MTAPTPEVREAVERLTWAQEVRQDYLAGRLMLVGAFNRSDLCRQFRISTPQASVDIRAFLAAHPEVHYDASAKCFR